MTFEQALRFSQQRGQRWMAIEDQDIGKLLADAITANRLGYRAALLEYVEIENGQSFGPVTVVLLDNTGAPN